MLAEKKMNYNSFYDKIMTKTQILVIYKYKYVENMTQI